MPIGISLTLLLLFQVQSKPGLPTQPGVISSGRQYEARLPDGGMVKILEIDVKAGEGYKVVWPQTKKNVLPRLPGFASQLEPKEGLIGVLIRYSVPTTGDSVMRRWIHDPEVEGTALKESVGHGEFIEPLFVPAERSSFSLRLGVPYGTVQTHLRVPVKPGVKPSAKAATFGESRDPKAVIVSALVSLNPSMFEFNGFAITRDGLLHKGVVASWNMDDYGRLVPFPPQDFKFPGLRAEDVSALVVKVRKVAYVEFRDIPIK